MRYLVIKTDNGYYKEDHCGTPSFTPDAVDAYRYKMLLCAEKLADRVFQKHRKLTFAKVVEVEAVAQEKETLYEVKG